MDLQLRSSRDDDGVVTLWLSSPDRSVVVLDSWLLDQLHAFFDRLDREDAPSGFVLMSASERVFVAGADLAEIDQLDDDALHSYLKHGANAFARIAGLPCPSVAAINGAALGGGMEIALHCDALIAQRPAPDAKPYRVGLPEAGLGLCPGWGGTQMLPARIDPAEAVRLTASGTTPKVTEVPTGLFESVVDAGADLHAAAIEHVRSMAREQTTRPLRCIDKGNRDAVRNGLDAVRAKLPETSAAGAVVEAIESGLAGGFDAGLETERRLLVGLRHTAEARRKLEAFFSGAR